MEKEKTEPMIQQTENKKRERRSGEKREVWMKKRMNKRKTDRRRKLEKKEMAERTKEGKKEGRKFGRKVGRKKNKWMKEGKESGV